MGTQNILSSAFILTAWSETQLSSCRQEKKKVFSFQKKVFYPSGVVDHMTTTDCRECLVNMATCHWTRAPQLYHILSYLLSFFNLLNRLPDHWLGEHHSSTSSSSQTPEVQGSPTIGCLVTCLSVLVSVNSHVGYPRPWNACVAELRTPLSRELINKLFWRL
jgi:hypothetical protein